VAGYGSGVDIGFKVDVDVFVVPSMLSNINQNKEQSYYVVRVI